MTNSIKRQPTGPVACPHCGAPAASSFGTVVEQDEAGPTKILYKCKSCGGFYTAERVISWQVNKAQGQ